MGRLNIQNLTKAEIVRMAKWRCPLPGHGKHTGLEHPQCYVRLAAVEERVGYFDIETAGLEADFNHMISWAIKEKGQPTIFQEIFRKEDLENRPIDRRIVEECVKTIGKFDCIVTFYGSRFDLPFLRSRALKAGIEFPFYGSIRHKDLYYVVRSKLHIHSNRLASACALFGIKGKTPIEPDIWERVVAGDEDALEYIAEHNRIDVDILEQLHEKLVPYMRETRTSI